VFARALAVQVIVEGEHRPCPLEWLDSFCMRRFTGNPAFDDTLPVGDGVLEASFRVDATRLASELGEWLTKKKGAGKSIQVQIRESEPAQHLGPKGKN